MCLSSGRSLWFWKQSWDPEASDLTEAEVNEACAIWEQFIWPMLDHSRNYCINPQEMIKAILRAKTVPAVDGRYSRRQYRSRLKDAEVSRRLRDVIAQSPPGSWRDGPPWLFIPER